MFGMFDCLDQGNDRIGDYRTIDWVHDSVKEKFRQKAMRGIPGIRGIIIRSIDALEGWVLAGIIGIVFRK